MTKRSVHCGHDIPIIECRQHWVEFCFITGNTIESRALTWATGGDTGISSKALCAYMSVGMTERRHSAPSDAADRGRCIRLLRLIPEWIERLDEMKRLDTGTISINGAPAIPVAQDTHSWTYQIPLIIKEGEFKYA